jgi:thiosulfate reductase cytochrome b subunit
MDSTHVKSLARQRRLHPLPLRMMHWINATAMIIMIASGWKIYEDEVYGLISGRFLRMLFPIRPREIIADLDDALHFRLQHDDLTRYNAVQKMLYCGIILVGMVQVLSGLAIWKPVQFSELLALFYDFQGGRLTHFLGMAAIVSFLVVHVLLALLVPRTLLAMLTGGPRVGTPTTAAQDARLG